MAEQIALHPMPDGKEEALKACRDIYVLIVRAMAERGECSFAYTFKEGHVISAADLAKIERAINRLIRGILKDCGVKLPKGWKVICPVRKIVNTDDDNSVICRLDFSRILN